MLTCWSPTREQGEWTLSETSESTCAFRRLFHRFVIFGFGFFSPTKINSFQLYRIIKKRLRFSLFQAGLKFLPGIRMKTVQTACSGAVRVKLGCHTNSTRGNKKGMLACFSYSHQLSLTIWRLYQQLTQTVVVCYNRSDSSTLLQSSNHDSCCQENVTRQSRLCYFGTAVGFETSHFTQHWIAAWQCCIVGGETVFERDAGNRSRWRLATIPLATYPYKFFPTNSYI